MCTLFSKIRLSGPLWASANNDTDHSATRFFTVRRKRWDNLGRLKKLCPSKKSVPAFSVHSNFIANCSGMVMFPVHCAKTILQGTVKGGRRQGRQRKRWEDNIRKWTGLEFAKSQGAVENREKWRKLVVKSSVLPQRPSRLRDRWWWWWWRRLAGVQTDPSSILLGLPFSLKLMAFGHCLVTPLRVLNETLKWFTPPPSSCYCRLRLVMTVWS